VAHGGRVFLSELETVRDPGLLPLEAMDVAMATFEAAYDAKRQAQPYHERRDYFDDPLWAELVRERQVANWPAELTDSDWDYIESEWRSRRGD
jgi:hypothetical protein